MLVTVGGCQLESAGFEYLFFDLFDLMQKPGSEIMLVGKVIMER